ncbi:hypothetical protein QN277_025843 [Acacia crassicarpa]|uniref:F-box domain-containing protein n=1 Tax=Acacia crassicarpa TaxID=499986 RepID=A0AAE1JAR4_9FABA|nr:hypothetical protein QN277_025843 [Acacia crassicarpa]
MLPKPFDSCLLQSLPDDLFAIISQFLSPRDVCNLSLCCGSLYALAASEKVWFTQCDMVDVLPHKDIVEWRKGVSSYKALCRFLISVQPIVGMWVHQNPELGNVVYVIPGFVSVVGCRVIPQELGPLGMEDGPILWAPVFEIIGDSDGSTTFYLHGRENGIDYIYPGLVKQIERACNVLLLEVEPTQQKQGDTLLQSNSMVHNSDGELSGNICSSNGGLPRSRRTGNNELMVPFSKLGFSDRRKLLEIITSQVRQKVPDMALGPLFPRFSVEKDDFQGDLLLLSERRSLFIQMYKLNSHSIHIDGKAGSQEAVGAVPSEVDEVQTNILSWGLGKPSDEVINYTHSNKRKSLGGSFLHSIKHILGKSSSNNGCHASSEKVTSSTESKHARLDDFLKSGDTIKLTLHASTVKLSSYRAWPNMHDGRFALYKLCMPVPTVDQEYAGLWGGTFGWPPGKPSKDKPGKALFLLLLSYEESEGQQFLIATKILEGTHYVLHPNGSAMFIVNTNEPSSEPFPWDADVDSFPVNIEHAFVGEGIATGYGFRYPGSKPGSLFVFHNGVLAFIWKESRAVLTLQRLNLDELLKKGEMVPALPPVANFSYLTKSYSNVFAGSQATPPCLSSSRKEKH